MSKTLRSAMAIISLSVVASGTFAAFAQDVNKNPYVVLYTKRVQIAQSEVAKQKKVVANEHLKWKRYQGLAAQGAMPRIESDNQETEYRMAVKTQQILEAEVARADALLRIAKERVAAGLDMPICDLDE